MNQGTGLSYVQPDYQSRKQYREAHKHWGNQKLD